MIRRQGTKDRQYVQWLEDKERRTNNMYNDQKTKNEGQTIFTMIRRQRTKDKQYVQWSEDKERRRQYVQWLEEKERRTKKDEQNTSQKIKDRETRIH